VIVAKEIAAPASTHITGRNQRLDPTLTANFRNRMTRELPNPPWSQALGDCRSKAVPDLDPMVLSGR
jgi:hypothetical protein